MGHTPTPLGWARSRAREGAWALTFACFLGLASPALGQQPITFQYIYDDLNQLTKVIDSAGVVIEYVYDQVGNILQINRSTIQPGALTIFNITPSSAATGTTVTIQGQGFSTNPALDVVTIGGLALAVVSATSTTLVVTVPAGAMSGSITVTVGGMTASSSTTETVIPAPIITSVTPRVMQAGTTANVTVTGANFVNTTFSFPGSGISVAAATPSPDGTSAVLTLIANATANGRFAVVGNNGYADSGPGLTMANAFSVFVDPTLDPDGDGLPNALELIAGTDPFNADTDGDGYSDGVEVASRSNPLDPASTPLNSRPSGDAESVPFGISNVGSTSAAQGEADSIPFGVLNTGATTQAPIEADSKPFSILDILPTTAVPAEADSLPFSVVNNPVGPSFPNEADTIPFSICNAMLGPTACSDYSGLTQATKPPAIVKTLPAGPTSEVSGTGDAQGPADGRAFSVLAVAPADQADHIAPRSMVTFAFSAPLDPATIVPDNFSLFAGERALDVEIRYSADFRTVSLSGLLPPDAFILAQVSDQVEDVWGRRLTAFESEFHTAAAPRAANPVVVAQRPGLGATAVNLGTAIHLSLGSATDWNQAHDALSITQDGEPVEGSIQITRSGTEIEFLSYAPFHSGAVVRISLAGTADRYEGLFTTAAPFDIAEPLRATPSGLGYSPLNPVIEFEYGRALNRSTVTAATVTLSEDSTSRPVPAGVMLRGDRVIRVTSSAPLSPDSRYTLEISGSIQDVDDRAATPIRRSFTTGSQITSGLPRLLSTRPADAATDVDANAEVHLLFDRPVNPLTLDSDTVRVSQGDAPVAASISLAGGGAEVIITPMAPLNDFGWVQVIISGVEDLSGGVLPSCTVRFQVPALHLAAVPLRDNAPPVRRAVFAPWRFLEFLVGRR